MEVLALVQGLALALGLGLGLVVVVMTKRPGSQICAKG